MKVKNARKYLFMLVLIVLTLACGLPSTAPTESSASDATEAPATESAPPTESTIQHTTIPVNLPSDQSGEAADFDASKVLTGGTLVGGDRFTFGRFERPFNAETMDTYFPQLDIVGTKVFQDETWIYASIAMHEITASSSANEKYAVEIDTNIDGKGDWLIIGLKPVSTDWTVNGVQIFQDTNQDVGLDLPTLTDEGVIGTSDGFETKVFDQGQGNDPDSAWIRISPNNPNIVEFAIKQSAIESPKKYLIGMWAGTSLLDPANFDINDKFTHEQAGAADAGLQVYYPIKAVAEIDNSCRMAVGFKPVGTEAGLCETLIPQVDNPPLGCQATAQEILACNSNPYGTWNAGTCSCDIDIPG